MPITLGILAQSRQAVAASDYVLLDSRVLTGSQASVEFTGLNATYSSTYRHLQVRMVVRSAGSGSAGDMRLNGSSAALYASHFLTGNGSTVTSYAYTGSGLNTGFLDFCNINASTGDWTAYVTDYLDAFSTTKNKTVRKLGAAEGNRIELTSGLFMSTNAIDTITFSVRSGSFAQHSRVALYGIRG